jgi:hypothetical protein
MPTVALFSRAVPSAAVSFPSSELALAAGQSQTVEVRAPELPATQFVAHL